MTTVMPNGYYGAGAKLAHPCYQIGMGFVCPECGEAFMTEAPFEWHYLRDHDPSEDQAREIVHWKRMGKHFQTDEWKEHQRKEKEEASFRKKAKIAGWKKGGFGMWYNLQKGEWRSTEELKAIL